MADRYQQKYVDENAAHKRTRQARDEALAALEAERKRHADAMAAVQTELATLRQMRDTQQFAVDAGAIFVGHVEQARAELDALKAQTLDRMAATVRAEVHSLRVDNDTLRAERDQYRKAVEEAIAAGKAAAAEVEPLRAKVARLENDRRDHAYRLAKRLGGPSCAGQTVNGLLRDKRDKDVIAFAVEAKDWLDGVLREQAHREAPPPKVEPPRMGGTLDPESKGAPLVMPAPASDEALGVEALLRAGQVTP